MGDLHTIVTFLLTILKIIGICFLAVLAILLLVLLTLLFVPVRYRSRGKLNKGNRQVMAKVSWLASAVSAVVRYENGKLYWTVKLLGVQILPKEKNKTPNTAGSSVKKESGAAKKRSEGKIRKNNNNAETENTNTKNGSEKNITENRSDAKKEHSDVNNGLKKKLLKENDDAKTENKEVKNGPKEKIEKKAGDAEKKFSDENRNIEREDLDKEDPGSFWEKFFQNIAHFFARLRERFQNIRENIVQIRERAADFLTKGKERWENSRRKAEHWKKFYHMEETQVTIGVLKKEVKHLVCYLMPTRIHAQIHFGFDDPADTGIALGAISAIYGFIPKGIELEPDFEEKILEGEWKLRGRVRLVYFVRLALRLLFRKENRITYRRMRKLLNS